MNECEKKEKDEEGEHDVNSKERNSEKKKRRKRTLSSELWLRSRPPRRGKYHKPEKETALNLLVNLLVEGREIVFITGAGLSVASGIAPFRGTGDAVWEQSVHTWGTREKFEEDPLLWYNTFWLKHFNEKKASIYAPNKGHDALAKICTHFSDTTRVITQNVDRLHRHSTGCVPQDQLIEIHGYAGGFKCFTDDCRFQSDRVHTASLKDVIKNGKIESSSDLPKCPDCSATMCPNTLLFDEDYSDHESYQFERAKTWLREADALVFVGTSFSVHITSLAFSLAAEKIPTAPVFNFNMVDNIDQSQRERTNTYFIPGPAEETLPSLCQMVT